MLKEILSISGQPGLFKMISKGKNNVIVESLLTGKRLPAFSSNKMTSLEDIAIFTISGEIPLKEVFKKIAEKESFGKTIDQKSSDAELKKYFKLMLPEYDENRVYTSDIKKVVGWYNLLVEKEMMTFEEGQEEENTEQTEN